MTLRKRLAPFSSLLTLAILAALAGGCRHTPASPPDDHSPDPPPVAEAIIVDHTCTESGRIPSQWLTQACSQLRLHYAHTSHGEQITVGLERLAAANSRYPFTMDFCRLPAEAGRLNLLDGQTRDSVCETYVTPDLYWESAAGLALTRHVLSHYSVTVSGWMWCSQLDDYTAGQVQQYLQAISTLETEFPNIRFIYFTGNAQSHEANRRQRNDQIREYCRLNRKALFDFGDLDCWYGGEPYAEDGIPMEHPRYHGDQAGHTTYASCENKARAFWWLMARLAGWDGL